MNRVLKYYARSSDVGLFALLLCFVAGCAGANQVARNAPHLTFADLNGPNRQHALATVAGGPSVIHFKRGERIPVDLALDSRLIDLEGSGLTLVAKRDFDLLLRGDGPLRVSGDGVDFESDHRNYFGFGFDVERDKPTVLRVKFGVLPEKQP